MKYSVKEIFYTLQGEGANAGQPAVFIRFAGCNLWSGKESDRSLAICQFCDTDFVGTFGVRGGIYTATKLAQTAAGLWPDTSGRFVVLTGGEPILQTDTALITELHELGFKIAVETNGTLPVPAGIDWICVSPKAGTEIVVAAGDELKLVFPQPGATPDRFEPMNFRHFYLQPMDGPAWDNNTRVAVQFCLAHPRWRLSLQTHKYLGIA